MSRSVISVSIIVFDLHFRILKKISLPVVSCCMFTRKEKEKKCVAKELRWKSIALPAENSKIRF